MPVRLGETGRAARYHGGPGPTTRGARPLASKTAPLPRGFAPSPHVAELGRSARLGGIRRGGRRRPGFLRVRRAGYRPPARSRAAAPNTFSKR